MSTREGVVLGGFARPGYEPVAAAFVRNFGERDELGAAFAAWCDGEAVVDLWAGVAERSTARPWREETLAPVFSGSKGLLATCLLLLVERGQLDLDAPACAYWPEFAARGKDGILVRHLVSHRAGLPGLTTPVSVEEATDPVRMASLLAGQAAIAPPGSWFYYHALTFGWLCGELVRRIDGRTAGRFFAEEVADRLGLEAWIGLPAEQEERVAVVEGEAGLEAREDREAACDSDPIAWSIWENPPRFEAGSLAANMRVWREAEVPASSGVASARSMARLYGCLARGGELDGIRILDPATLELASTPLTCGLEPILEKQMCFGVGFELQNSRLSFGPAREAFGHTGAGGSVHGAWPGLATGFSYVTNSLREFPVVDPRSEALLGALHEAVSSR